MGSIAQLVDSEDLQGERPGGMNEMGERKEKQVTDIKKIEQADERRELEAVYEKHLGRLRARGGKIMSLRTQNLSDANKMLDKACELLDDHTGCPGDMFDDCMAEQECENAYRECWRAYLEKFARES